MRDREFLIWIHDRLHHFHKESELLDYMHKLRAIISEIPEGQETPNDGRGKNGIVDLLYKVTPAPLEDKK